MSMSDPSNLWLCWILASSFCLSFYDLCKKASVKGNAAVQIVPSGDLPGKRGKTDRGSERKFVTAFADALAVGATILR